MVRTCIFPAIHRTHTSQIDPLRCRSESGFRNVYRAKVNAAGVTVWVAKVKVGGVLKALPGSRHPQPHVCAGFVARWYADRYGPRWPDVLRARKVNPFLVRRSQRYGGFVAAVWVEGRREEVIVMKKLKRNRWEAGDDLAVFPSRAAALRGVWVYLARRYGLFGSVLLWRERPAVGRSNLAA